VANLRQHADPAVDLGQRIIPAVYRRWFFGYQRIVKLDQAYVEGAKLNLDYTNIISPVNGTVASMTAFAGHFRLSPGSGHIAAPH